DRDRPLGVRIAALRRRDLREGHLVQDEVTLVDQRLDLLDDLLGIARGRKNAAQFLELELEAMHLFTELRELALRRTTLLDLGVELLDLCLSGLDLIFRVFDPHIVREPDETTREDDTDGESVVPRLPFQ